MIDFVFVTLAKIALVMLVTVVVTAVAAVVGDRIADHGGKP